MPDGRYFGSLRVLSNLCDQTFPLFGTTSLAANDGADKCLSANRRKVALNLAQSTRHESVKVARDEVALFESYVMNHLQEI